MIINKSYLGYLNKLVDECNNSYHNSIGKTNSKAPKSRARDRVGITKYKNIFSKGYTKNWSREIFVIDSVLKINPWTHKLKNLKGEKTIGNFYEKELLLS